ncbi:general substrate transporter [Meredithblackwellia eburnea MCA 4105]
MTDTNIHLAHKENKTNGNVEFVEDLGILDESLVEIPGEGNINGYTLYLAVVAGLAGWLFGWDTAVVSPALSNIGTALDHHILTDTQHEWAVASLSVGALFGSLGGGILSDTFGRKPVLQFGDLCFLVGGVLICSSTTLIQFIVGRVIMGVGTGIAAVVSAMFLGELAPSRVRGRLVSIQSVLICAGQFTAYACGAGLENVRHGWIILFALGIPFALFQGVAMHWLPESPRFCVIQGRQDIARDTLAKIYPIATPEQVELKLKVIQLSADISNSMKREYQSIWTRLYVLLTTGRYFRPTLIATILFLVQQLSGQNTLMYYSSTLFSLAGFSYPPAAGLLISGVNCLMTVISMFTMDPFGRRTIFLIGAPVMIVSLIIASVAFAKMTESSGGQLVADLASTYPKEWVNLMLAMMVIFIVGYAPSFGTIAYTSIELMPLEVRGMGSAIAIAFQWAGNVFISATYLTIMNGIGPAGSYGLYCGFVFLGFVAIYFMYPEPSGLSIEETGSLFDEGFGVKKSERLRKAHKQVRRDTAARDLS